VNRGIAYPDGIGRASNASVADINIVITVVRFDPASTPNALLALPMVLL
jgi:hypothetical protein